MFTNAHAKGIKAIAFCQVPDTAPHAAGEVVPFFYVQWMRHFKCWREMQVMLDRERNDGISAI